MSRLQAWALESRTRYALVWGGVTAAAVGAVMLLAGRSLADTAVGLVLGVLSAGLIWYPLAKRRLTTRRG